RTVSFRAVSGHRDAYPTECPGNLIYPELPAIARAASLLGLPKIFAPRIQPTSVPVTAGGFAGPITFSGTAAGASGWTVKVLDRLGGVIAQQSGLGTAIAWTWDGRATNGQPAAAASVASWRMDAIALDGTQALAATGGFGGKAPPVSAGTGGLA